MTNLQLDPPVEIFSRIELPGQLFTTVSVPEDSTLVLLNQQSLNLHMEVMELNSSLLIGQGPAGVSAEEEMKYAKRTDFVGTDVVYKGEAVPGTAENASGWRISRISFVGEDIEELWAEGTADFNKMWSERASYTYQ